MYYFSPPYLLLLLFLLLHLLLSEMASICQNRSHITRTLVQSQWLGFELRVVIEGEGRTTRVTAATPHWPRNVIRSRIGLIALDSFLRDYGWCRPPTGLHLLESWMLTGLMNVLEADLIDFSLSCYLYTNK